MKVTHKTDYMFCEKQSVNMTVRIKYRSNKGWQHQLEEVKIWRELHYYFIKTEET